MELFVGNSYNSKQKERIPLIQNRFLAQIVLGEGTYGVVYRAYDILKNEVVAIKQFRILNSHDPGVHPTTLREISILKEVKHPNVISFSEILTSHYGIYLVMEFLHGGDLGNLIRKKRNSKQKMSLDLVRSFSFQLLLGLDFCHNRRIIHRDLKPHNLLLDGHGVLKIADFGLARAVAIPMCAYTHEVVTLWYRPPEILLGEPKYSLACDIWSVGCIMAEMFTSTVLFRGDSEIHQLFKIFEMLGTPSELVWPGICQLPDYCKNFPCWPTRKLKANLGGLITDKNGFDVVDRMLVYDPSTRMTAKMALNSNYFADIRKEKYPGFVYSRDARLEMIKILSEL